MSIVVEGGLLIGLGRMAWRSAVRWWSQEEAVVCIQALARGQQQRKRFAREMAARSAAIASSPFTCVAFPAHKWHLRALEHSSARHMLVPLLYTAGAATPCADASASLQADSAPDADPALLFRALALCGSVQLLVAWCMVHGVSGTPPLVSGRGGLQLDTRGPVRVRVAG